MDNYVIYEDEKMKVEIDGRLHQLLSLIKVQQVKLDSLEEEYFNSLIKQVNRYLNEIGIKKDAKVTYCSRSIVLMHERYVTMSPPFDVFCDATDCICYDQLFAEHPKETISVIQSIYAEDGINIGGGILQNPTEKVYGYLCIWNDEKSEVKVMFFGYSNLFDIL